MAQQLINRSSTDILRVAIDGVDGAGKTTFADALAPYIEALGRPVIRASIDGFHLPTTRRYQRGPDSPEGFYLDSFDYDAVKALLLEPLGPGGNRLYRTEAFDWRTDSPIVSPPQMAPENALLLFDGIFSQRPELSNYWDLCIYLDVSFDETLKRTVRSDWVSTSSTDEKRRRFWARYAGGQKIYLNAANPRASADILIDNNDPAKPQVIEALQGVTPTDLIILEEYNARWPQVFKEFSESIQATLNTYGVKAIEHVGSTAIPGMRAKPVVDIMVGVESLRELPDRHDQRWISLGEWGHGDDSDEDWFYFIKRDIKGKRVAHIHIVPFEGPFWNKMIVFRDALRADKVLADEYCQLKLDLASKYRNERLKYLDGKA
ncbi:MAG: GrpB family protein, partial [Candidatus Baltobacteraceae bacterium]